MQRDIYPIIEFDDSRNTLIDVTKNLHSRDKLPPMCVISFFGEAVKEYVHQNNGVVCGKLVLESFELPLYKIQIGENAVVLLHGLCSGPYMAGQLEKLIAMGCQRFIVCGGCGVLVGGSSRGQLFVPDCALRDEGTSYHYVKPSREIQISNKVKERLSAFLNENDISFSFVKTWTTDAMYRETPEAIANRKQEGCQIVEMECASCYAVAQYKGVDIGFLLYAGDDVSGKVWDSRSWKSDYGTRYNLIDLSTRAVTYL